MYRRFLLDSTIGKIVLNDYFFPLIYLINNSFSLASFITFHRSHWILFNGVPFFLKFLLLDNISTSNIILIFLLQNQLTKSPKQGKKSQN